MRAAVRRRPYAEMLDRLSGGCYRILGEVLYLRKIQLLEGKGKAQEWLICGQQYLADKCNLARETVSRLIGLMRQMGIIQVRFRPPKKTGPHAGEYQTNQIRLTPKATKWHLAAVVNHLNFDAVHKWRRKKEAPRGAKESDAPHVTFWSNKHLNPLNNSPFVPTRELQAPDIGRRASAPEPEKPEKPVRGGPVISP